MRGELCLVNTIIFQNSFRNTKTVSMILKTGNHAHFNRLYGEYNEVDNNIYRIEEGIENTSDEHLEKIKKQCLSLKDELFSIIMKA